MKSIAGESRPLKYVGLTALFPWIDPADKDPSEWPEGASVEYDPYQPFMFVEDEQQRTMRKWIERNRNTTLKGRLRSFADLVFALSLAYRLTTTPTNHQRRPGNHPAKITGVNTT